ncbi:MAG: M20/M25/M40 family metallo-hydrolase [Bacteroidales bacterium]|nr:M20/M25/M40 family metallo-hydrolase [Bacteroidales bacterium]HPD94990.1 M20/M25/M40 family metallo-hydrolase [Tenuifilaceae bacterium]HRX30467.1 M20/M25/M40 family metallo-hydrolase [Tenuifilaceae bacterium]
MKKFIILTALSIALTISVSAQTDTTIQKIIQIGKTDNQTMVLLDELCNRIGGRLIGSSAYEDAVLWAARKFQDWGMDIMLDEVGQLPVGFNRGPWFGKLLTENGMILHFATPSYTAGTKGVQRGHVVIEPKTQREFDRMKGKLKGAWVLVSGESNGWPLDFSTEASEKRKEIIAKNEEIEKQNSEIRRENWQNRNNKEAQKELIPYIEEPALFYQQMADAGVLGFIQKAPVPIRVLYDRKNLPNMSWNNLPKVPDIKLDEKQYAVIEKMAKERQYFQLEFDIRNHFRPGPIPYYSLIGVIKGTEYPNQYVIMGGHLDAFDVATGASDNASGAVPAMEAARLIMKSGAKPKRTILVCLWAGEEFGLLGSSSWVEKHANELDSVSIMLNRDGGPTVANGLSVPKAMYPDFEEICKPLNSIDSLLPFTLREVEPKPKPTHPGGTDTSPFLMAGIPAFQFETQDVNGYDFNYGEIWHTERDTYEKCPANYMNHTSIVTAIVALGVANLDHLLSRENFFAPQKEDNNTKVSKKKKIK